MDTLGFLASSQSVDLPDQLVSWVEGKEQLPWHSILVLL